MTETGFDRRSVWVPQKRPEWMEALNNLGDTLDPKGIIDLSASSLIEQAKAHSGLSDFGDDQWLDHFQMLMDAIDSEANLHLAGRLLTRCEFLIYLEARLRIVEAYKKQQKIEAEKINKPVFITGYARSGTTILFEMLAQDPQFRVASKSEALNPVSDMLGLDDAGRVAKQATALSGLLDEMTPEFKSAHKSGADLPVESLETEYPAFLSDVFPIAFQIPSYVRYLMDQDLTGTIEWQEKTLKLLQWGKEAKHWLMKSPSHLPHLRTILNVFPDMRVIFTHRDPIATADSVVSVMGTLYWLRTNFPWGEREAETWSLTSGEARAAAWDEVMELIDTDLLRKGRYANFHYAEFMVDPISCIQKIYQELELDLSTEAEAAMRSFIQSKTKGKFGTHAYEAAPTEIVESERANYARYEQFFEVAREV